LSIDLEILDLLGKVVLQINNSSNRIDVSTLPSGMYYLRIGDVYVKFIKQ